MIKLADMFYNIQHYLFPELEEILGELTVKHKEFVRTIELIDIKKYAASFAWKGVGCKPHDREAIIKSYKGTIVEKVPRRLELQDKRTLDENLSDLPLGCDWGTKKDFNVNLNSFLDLYSNKKQKYFLVALKC